MRLPGLAVANPLHAIETPEELLSLALQLGAGEVAGWSSEERSLAKSVPEVSSAAVEKARTEVKAGRDPLGDVFCRLRSLEARRPLGATYTPQIIVDAMMDRALRDIAPARVVDPGVGSARFLVAAGRQYPNAELIGIEIDPLASILARGHLCAAGLASRATVLLQDFRKSDLPRIDARTLFLGNPPYVRHHQIDPRWKAWLVETARELGLDASQLAGLHVHFFLAIAKQSRPGDMAILITAAEWLDVNYGHLVRDLLLDHLGGKSIHVIEPSAAPFPGTATTAAITICEIGTAQRGIGLRRVADLDALQPLETHWSVRRERLQAAHRWSVLTRPATAHSEGFIELGELCRVHRGQVTGANRVWVAGPNASDLPPSVLFASITKAKELFLANGTLSDVTALRNVIDIPADLDVFDPSDLRPIERFLRFAKSTGADQGYIARHRRAWWSVGLREPAPILATYMARRPPAFVRNVAQARHINVAHGIYPREPLSERALRNLATFLSASTSVTQGRMYAGGLTKFEPKEMERLMVPLPEQLEAGMVS